MGIQRSILVISTAVTLAGSSDALMWLWENPQTRPVATMSSWALIGGHYLMYCPLARTLGWQEEYERQCVI